MIYDIEQGTEEWFEIRKGKMTGSHAQEIANKGAGLKTYTKKLMAEYYSSKPKEQYSNEHTERGNELEDQARELYSLETGREVKQVGFIELSDYHGCSPDGICKDRAVEIKCHDDEKHFEILIEGEKAIPSKYKWQMQFEMLATEKDKCDYVAYNPNFSKSLVIIEISRDDEMISEIKSGIEMGVEIIKELKEKYDQKI